MKNLWFGLNYFENNIIYEPIQHDFCGLDWKNYFEFFLFKFF